MGAQRALAIGALAAAAAMLVGAFTLVGAEPDDRRPTMRSLPPRALLPVAVRVRPRSGRPTTRFRLELVATYPARLRGRREQDYWAAVHGPHGVACVIQNEAWFSHGPAGAHLRAVLDPSRTKGLRWCRGRFRGVLRYRDGICRRRGPCERVSQRTAGHFRFTVR